MTYTILSALRWHELADLVNAHLAQGWKLQGGVAVDPHGTPYQAMVKEGEPPIVCPRCSSSDVFLERRPAGKATCKACRHEWVPK